MYSPGRSIYSISYGIMEAIIELGFDENNLRLSDLPVSDLNSSSVVTVVANAFYGEGSVPKKKTYIDYPVLENLANMP